MRKRNQYKTENQRTQVSRVESKLFSRTSAAHTSGCSQAVCYEFKKTGRCKWGSGCRFSHSTVKEDDSVNVDMLEVNKKVQAIRLELHNGRKDGLGNETLPPSQVRLTTVIAHLCKLYKVGAIKELVGVVEHDNSSCRRKLDINLIDQLRIICRLEEKIDTYIRAHLFSRTICTLYSLDKQIAADFSNTNKTIERYAELQMGPLVCHRMVREKFLQLAVPY